MEEIIAKGAPDSSFLWPMELIVPSQGNLFGYIMPLRPKNYKSIVDLMKNRVNPSFYVICRTAFNLTKGYRNLHIAGAKYQDISFGNLFFNPDNGDVLICDNDNVSYGNSKPGGVLGTPGFMAPEIVRGEARPSRDTDRYSLAVLLFYLFMVNHPLEGKQEASIKCMDMAARVKLYGTDPILSSIRIIRQTDRCRESMITPIFIGRYIRNSCASCLSNLLQSDLIIQASE